MKNLGSLYHSMNNTPKGQVCIVYLMMTVDLSELRSRGMRQCSISRVHNDDWAGVLHIC